MSLPYAYPVPNSQLIAAHALQAHFEGGFFAQTVSLSSVPTPAPSAAPSLSSSPSASAEPSRPPSPTLSASTATLENRTLTAAGAAAGLLNPKAATVQPPMYADATQIYYLLTPGSYRGRMHMNLHATFHVHHAGRALYTLIHPVPGSAPEVRRVVVGSDVAAGEVTQLFVPGGWWKASEIPEADLERAQAGGVEEEERVGCLISEVVVPGWNPEQHQFIDMEKLQAMWGGGSGWEVYEKYIAPPSGLVYPDKE